MLGFTRHSMIESRIKEMNPGEVFSIADFTDISEAKTVSKVLGRLCDDGKCAKLLRGVFWKPDGKEPSPHLIAQAIARSNTWDAVACGDTALHVLGVEEKEPENWTYVTGTGTYRKYSVNGIIITFKKATSKAYGAISKETAQMVQFLKCGKKADPSKQSRMRHYIDRFFSNEQKKRIKEEAPSLSSWFRRMISKVLPSEQVKKA